MPRRDKYEYDLYENTPGGSNLTGKASSGAGRAGTAYEDYALELQNADNPYLRALILAGTKMLPVSAAPVDAAQPAEAASASFAAPASGGTDVLKLPTSDPQYIFGELSPEKTVGVAQRGSDSLPQVQSRYAELVDALVRRAMDREPFFYDYESDPLYQQYAKAYGDLGRRAMQNTLAQVSARTGGLASSYAGSVAQQAMNNYMARLGDVVPELEQRAYGRWQDEGDELLAKLALAQQLDNTDYGRSSDDWSRAYQLSRDAVSDAAAAYDRKLALAQLGGSYGDYTGLGELGITPNTDNLLALALANNARTAPIGSGGISGSGGGSKGKTSELASRVNDGIQQTGNNNGLLSESRLKLYQQTAAEIYSQYGAKYLADWLERIQKEGHLNKTDATAIGTYVLGG